MKRPQSQAATELPALFDEGEEDKKMKLP